MYRRLLCVVICLSFCMIAFTSYGSNAREYVFDNAITFNSTIDDVKAKYGTPDKEDSYMFPIEKQTGPHYLVNAFVFDNFSFRGFEDCKSTFRFTLENKLLEYDVVVHYIHEQDYEKMFNELVSEYGEPSVKEQSYGDIEVYETIWDKQFIDTIVKLTYYKDTNQIGFTVKNATYVKP